MSTIPELTKISTIADNALLLLSYSGLPSEIASFYDLKRNLTNITSAGSNDLTLGIGNSNIPVFRINNSNKYVGLAYSDTFSPTSLLHISGTTGQNCIFTLENPSGYSGLIKFIDSGSSWFLGKNPSRSFILSGINPSELYNNTLLVQNNGDILLTDGSQYSKFSLDTGINIQFSAGTGIRFSLNNNTNSNDFTINHSGLYSEKDIYINYFRPANAVSGSFFGLSGAVFVDKDDGTVRIGNTNRDTDARLMISNLQVASSPYKTVLVEDAGIPNIFFKSTGSSNSFSILYDQSSSQVYLGRNKSSASVSSSDRVIFDLANGRVGLGGIDPSYPLDVTGSSALISRFQTNTNYAFTRIQSNYFSTGPVDYVASAYGSGDYNSFLIGYDFDKSSVGPSGPVSGPRQGQFFFQTGDSSNIYDSSRNIVTISDQGDINAKGIYTSDNEFCYGKFIDIHRASNLTGGAVYLNLDNIDYGYVRTGSIAYHSFMPMSGRIIGVDFCCQLNSGMNNSTGFLVWNRFTGLQLTNVLGSTYVSGSSSPSNRKFLQIWNPVTNNFSSPDLTNNCYVSGIISGQGILNLKARISNTTGGSRFTNNTAFLNFDRDNWGSWVAYAVSSAGIVSPLSGAMNLNTMVEYFVASDTDISSNRYTI